MARLSTSKRRVAVSEKVLLPSRSTLQLGDLLHRSWRVARGFGLHLCGHFVSQLFKLVDVVHPEIVEQRPVVAGGPRFDGVAFVGVMLTSEAADEVAERCVDAGRPYQPTVDPWW